MQFLALAILLAILVLIPGLPGFLIRRRLPKLGRFLIAVGIILGLGQIAVWSYDMLGYEAAGRHKKIRHVVSKSPDVFLKSLHSPPTAILVLSNMAQGVCNQAVSGKLNIREAQSALDKILTLALSPKIKPEGLSLEGDSFPAEGYYLAHLNIILGAYKRATGREKHKDLNKNISTYLAGESMKSSNKHLKSRQDQAMYYPANQAAVLYSLAIYDNNYKSNIGSVASQAWVDYMKVYGAADKGKLFKSELSEKTWGSKHSRGSSLSRVIGLMGLSAPREARTWYDLFKDEFKVNWFVIAGFREFYPGKEAGLTYDRLKETIKKTYKREPTDNLLNMAWENRETSGIIGSGPVFLDIGAAATGFGLGAARSMNDFLTYYQIKNIMILVRGASFVTFGPSGRRSRMLFQDPLVNAVLYKSETCTAWY